MDYEFIKKLIACLERTLSISSILACIMCPTNPSQTDHRNNKLPESHSGPRPHEYHLSLFGILDPHEPGKKI
jgi:hypothetical protein